MLKVDALIKITNHQSLIVSSKVILTYKDFHQLLELRMDMIITIIIIILLDFLSLTKMVLTKWIIAWWTIQVVLLYAVIEDKELIYYYYLGRKTIAAINTIQSTITIKKMLMVIHILSQLLITIIKAIYQVRDKLWEWMISLSR